MAVAASFAAKPKDVGGFEVRRALPMATQRAVGPFVFLDQMGPALVKAGHGLDVRPHPHIGLSTMTYLYEGEILHRDSLGTVQAISPGAVNWMTAGRGIAHSERTPPHLRANGHRLSGLQFWVALPAGLEEVEPSFLHLDRDALPGFSQAGVEMRLLAGRFGSLESSLPAPHPMIAADFNLAAGARVAIPADWAERALYVSSGTLALDGREFHAGELVVLRGGVAAEAGATIDTRMMLLGGEPLEAPRHIWWNFVSSSRDRIEQAKEDWRMGRFAPVPGETEFIPLPD